MLSNCERACIVVCEKQWLDAAKLMSTIARSRPQKIQVKKTLLLREKKLRIARSRFTTARLAKGCQKRRKETFSIAAQATENLINQLSKIEATVWPQRTLG